MAAARTKQFLFDYQNLSNFEKLVMRRIIPFYTFTRKNLERQVRTLLTDPGRSATQLKGVNTLGEVLAGGILTEEQRESLPEWVRDGLFVLKAQDGKSIEILRNFGTPLEQPFDMFQPQQFFGSISPLIRVPVEIGTGYSFFKGKPLSQITNATGFKHAPDILKDWIGYTEIKGTRSDGTKFEWSASLRPARMHVILNMPPTSRVFSFLQQVSSPDVSKASRVIQQLTGIRPQGFDLEVESARREKELLRQMEDLLTTAGVTAQFRRTFIPKDR